MSYQSEEVNRAMRGQMTEWERKNKWWEAFLAHAIAPPQRTDWRAHTEFADKAVEQYEQRFYGAKTDNNNHP